MPAASRGSAGRAPSAVFLDRDGVINEKAQDGDYVKSWDEFHFLPGAVDGILKLNTIETPIVVVTNQRGISLGLMTEAELIEIHEKMLAHLRSRGARVDAIYFCPHGKEECDCRKPGTGMFVAAQRDLALDDLRQAVVIGDSPSDMKAAESLGAWGILVGAQTSSGDASGDRCTRTADLGSAAQIIVRQADFA